MVKRKPQVDDEIMAPGWVVTYGDLMSLLLVFFVLIVSFSTTERIKFRKAIGSLKGGTSFLDPNTGTSPITMDEFMNMEQELETSIGELTEMLEVMGLESMADYYQDEKGIRFVLKSPILFDEARAELKLAVAPVLDQIALIISKYPHERVIIEGHTDNTPIHTELYPSNWELSSARSMAVLKYYYRRNLVAPGNLASMGYGEFHPLVPNTTAGNKARNRRVEIFIEKATTARTPLLPELNLISPEKTAP
ncbi:MAG: OmpA family protein [Candidatus Delongbacteria bacterium]|nr:OmpA family protein [Candidatus Delongbacteria bacterium]